MKSNIQPLLPETYYHIYNRGINGEQLFKQERNYSYFLEKYSQYMSDILDTYAYCLMGNHFHFLIRTKSEIEILNFLKTKKERNNTEKGKEQINQEYNCSKIISKQFSDLFNAYAQSINKATGRTGGLLETPFRRIEVKTDSHFSQLVYYIHANPQKHGFCEDFRDYKHSSFWSHLSLAKSKLKRNEVLDWFGDVESYKKFHGNDSNFDDIKGLIIEFD